MSMATAPHPLRSPLRSVVADYVTLTKPRIMMLILITAYGAMAFAADGLPLRALFTENDLLEQPGQPPP